MKAQRTKTCRLEPIDAAILHVWYSDNKYITAYRESVRRFLLASTGWPHIARDLPSGTRRRVMAAARRAGFADGRGLKRRPRTDGER